VLFAADVDDMAQVVFGKGKNEEEDASPLSLSSFWASPSAAFQLLVA
jgi:hypothetical protein